MEPPSHSSPLTPRSAAPSGDVTLLLSPAFAATATRGQLGREAYSYRFVQEAFLPLLQRWAQTTEVLGAESRLDYAAREARRRGATPVHLSFRPLHATYLTRQAANVAFPFWEFPNIPDTAINGNPRNNWVRIAEHLDLIVTASTFTRDAFVRAGVQTPVAVIPVPLPDEYFTVPAWQKGQQVTLPCPCYELPGAGVVVRPEPGPWAGPAAHRPSWRVRLHQVYQDVIKPRLPERLRTSVALARRAAESALDVSPLEKPIPYSPRATTELSGIVYTTVCNPFDPRKNWHDLLSAFLLALGDRPDATLVLKLVTAPEQARRAVNFVLLHYHQLGIRHRCRLVLLPAHLAQAELVELARASTYYVNTSRAEGACLPLQGFLAAGRPGIAPTHTALGDYFHEGLGFVLDAHPEPTCWPHDATQRCTTRWHRLVWQSLHDALQQSYEVARQEPEQYQALADRARAQMGAHASADEVWPRLAAALARVRPRLPVHGPRRNQAVPSSLRLAS